MINISSLEPKDISLYDQGEDIALVNAFLSKFGYKEKEELVEPEFTPKTKDALQAFQRTMNISESGNLDSATVEALQMPRCGVPDLSPGNLSLSAFTLSGCSYQAVKRILNYTFVNATPDIPGDNERDAIRRALGTWQAVTSLDFREVPSTAGADLRFGWFAGDHGDGSGFDGVGNVLAHAFFPPPCGGAHAGSCHFDEAENWDLTGTGGNVDLETVALHEIGHLLGLQHSNVPNSVMFASYSGPRRQLAPDDIAGIEALYGKRGLELRVLVHLEGMGDIERRDNEFSGTRGQSRRLEGFQIAIATSIQGLSCRYMAHLEGIGDTGWVNEGQFVGTRGQSRRLEGFAIELTGPQAPNYDVIYMGHLQNSGDTGYARNGQFCGTRGQSRRLEGLLVRVQRK
ncbi:MAG: matrixin family metalloprotease [Candidatus Eremiobacteraeota bacterium]|nr:matrixin family metalloprotease [Candidatus Eremiobacteraeota bacterium]